jgi:DNA-binding MarR family transcriptional regulator
MLTIMTPTVHDVTRTDAGLASQLRVSVMRLGRRLRSEREPDNQLGLGALSVLGVLLRHGESTIGELAAQERVRPPSMTRTVSCLVDEGYAVRRPSETDGRSTLVAISERGREVLLADRRRRDAWLARQLKDLTAEERDLLRRVAPLIERLASS